MRATSGGGGHTSLVTSIGVTPGCAFLSFLSAQAAVLRQRITSAPPSTTAGAMLGRCRPVALALVIDSYPSVGSYPFSSSVAAGWPKAVEAPGQTRPGRHRG